MAIGDMAATIEDMHESVNEAKYKVGDTITVIRKDGMKYMGTVEKLNPLKLRTDSTSTVVLPNPMIKKVVKESINEYFVENFQDVKELVEFLKENKPSLSEAEYQGRKSRTE